MDLDYLEIRPIQADYSNGFFIGFLTGISCSLFLCFIAKVLK